MSKETKKPKSSNTSPIKKPKPVVEKHLKNQQREKSRLIKDLHTVVSQEKELQSLIYEKNKIIVDLEKSIQERDEEILKSNKAITELKEENAETLKSFSIVAENFYLLEAQYDKNCQFQKQENDELKEKLQNQQSGENQKIKELYLCCQNLEKQLQDKTHSFMKVNEDLLDTIRKFDKMKQASEKQQIDFENYKKHVEEEKKIHEENYNFKFAEFKNNLSHKENLIKKYMADNENLVKEKNNIIDELNNKIHRIERAFSQPTKVVQPMLSIPIIKKHDVKPNQNNAEEISFVHVKNPQLSEPVGTQLNPETSPVNNEMEKPDNNMPKPRQYKFKRPSQHPTNLKKSNTTASATTANTTNRKRQSQRDLPTPGSLKYMELYSTSSTDDDSDDDSICKRQWRPKQPKDVCFVPDTSDASEGFAEPKRVKK